MTHIPTRSEHVNWFLPGLFWSWSVFGPGSGYRALQMGTMDTLSRPGTLHLFLKELRDIEYGDFAGLVVSLPSYHPDVYCSEIDILVRERSLMAWPIGLPFAPFMWSGISSILKRNNIQNTVMETSYLSSIKLYQSMNIFPHFGGSVRLWTTSSLRNRRCASNLDREFRIYSTISWAKLARLTRIPREETEESLMMEFRRQRNVGGKMEAMIQLIGALHKNLEGLLSSGLWDYG